MLLIVLFLKPTQPNQRAVCVTPPNTTKSRVVEILENHRAVMLKHSNIIAL
jgi:hypothetical protein